MLPEAQEDCRIALDIVNTQSSLKCQNLRMSCSKDVGHNWSTRNAIKSASAFDGRNDTDLASLDRGLVELMYIGCGRRDETSATPVCGHWDGW